VAVAPGSRDVYVSAVNSDAVSLFVRDPATGKLEFRRCWASATFGCSHLGVATSGVDGAHSVTLAPDGGDVYVASVDADALAHFSRDPQSGELSFEHCFGPPGAADGCADLPAPALDGSHWAVVSEDGADVYVVGNLANALVHFSRAPGGALEFEECHAEGVPGCTETAGPGGSDVDAISDPHWVTISPDGGSVYAASVESDAVAWFARDAGDGSLAFAGCMGESAAGGCTGVGAAHAVDGVHSVAVSPDSRHLYSAAQWSNTVSVFERDPSGALTLVECWGQGAWGCKDVSPVQTLGFVHSVSVSPSGADVYTAALGGDAVAHFTRDPSSGRLTLSACVGQGAPGCADLSPTQPLDGPDHAVAGPDGNDVYVTSHLSDSLAHFSRELPASGAPAGQATPGAPAAPVTGSVGALVARRMRISRRTLLLSRSGHVRVALTCPAGGPDCSGAVTIRRAAATGAARRPVLLGARRFTAAAGTTRSVAIRLSRRGRAFVRRAGRLRVRVSVKPAGARPTRRLVALRARRGAG
jgi:6-phosphogluconolactonase (cycloisomerase 2 family)